MNHGHAATVPGWDAFANEPALAASLKFLAECDKLKGILRRSRLCDGSRRENSAEHSWHVALMAVTLARYANEPIVIERVVRMLLVHDLVEIDAGDTYCYDDAGNANKLARETAAAERIFGLLPAAESAAWRALWEEFESATTPESRFARAIDRLQPILLNLANEGRLWTENGISEARIRAANGHVADGSQVLWEVLSGVIDHAGASGWLAPDGEKQ